MRSFLNGVSGADCRDSAGSTGGFIGLLSVRSMIGNKPHY